MSDKIKLNWIKIKEFSKAKKEFQNKLDTVLDVIHDNKVTHGLIVVSKHSIKLKNKENLTGSGLNKVFEMEFEKLTEMLSVYLLEIVFQCLYKNVLRKIKLYIDILVSNDSFKYVVHQEEE